MTCRPSPTVRLSGRTSPYNLLQIEHTAGIIMVHKRVNQDQGRQFDQLAELLKRQLGADVQKVLLRRHA